MAAKTVKEFIEEFRNGFNPITGERNLYRDITDEMIWNAAIKSMEENGSSHNSDYAKCPKCGDGLQISCTNAGCDYIEKVKQHFA